ncbi:hypothetical protein PAXINDRAFT_12138 [Paxillus involutus ATCC 200175]|uniref:RNA helicase n=1 Tax=Paxillus involutus ATCC 200175 TaxID=664439 RepID=A0A0C9SYU5_PAXIN|nr:hypothetical protein PAXINDRAFT_12138 [Paxillus involutus ATCC 200175]
MTPLRQFKGVPQEVIWKAEGKKFPWYRYFNLNPPELGELIGIPNAGGLVHRLVRNSPKLQLQPQAQPITCSLLHIDLSITPDFRWDEKIHGTAETFFSLVEDRYAEDEHNVTITVPMLEPVPPNYYISVVSDRWLHAETRLPISFNQLIPSEKFPMPTALLDFQPHPLSALHSKEFEAIYSNTSRPLTQFRPSGKMICAEFALLMLWSKKDHSMAVCVEPYQEMVDQRVAKWRRKFSGVLEGGKEMLNLTGETSTDLRRLEKDDVIVCTPSQRDVLSRRWRQRKNVQTIALLIADG